MGLSSIATPLDTPVRQFADGRGGTALLNAVRYLYRQPRLVQALLFMALFVLLGTPESMEGGGPPIGILARSQYRSEDVQLHNGEVLVAYTDGVVDALNPQQEESGEKRLNDIVRSSLSLSATQVCKRIAAWLQAFVAEGPQFDDITLVVMKVKPK
jgi:serine/threonine protein phosphatase PrpC